MRIRKIFLLIVMLVCSWQKVSAHQTGASWEKIVNNYKVDVGYDPTTIVAGQSQRFDFNILSSSGTESVAFSDVWVRVSKEQNTVFASGIHHPTLGLTGMIFVFPKAGDYTLDVRFENNDNTIVESSFQIGVVDAQATVITSQGRLPLWELVIAAGGGLVFGAGVVFVLKGKKNEKKI